MSTHAVPIPDVTDRFRDLVATHVRPPTNVTGNGAPAGQVLFVFTPNLTAPQTALFGELLALSRALVLEPADYVAIKAELPAIVAFMSGTPTQAEAVAALRSVIRVLRAILRNGS
jgi:hypothetical protein